MMTDEERAALTERVYGSLQEYIGRENAISAKALSGMFDISDRELRNIIRDIRNDPARKVIVGSSNNGYYICKEDEFAITNRRLKAQAFSLLKTAYANEKKAAKDGQFFMTESDYCLSVVEAFGHEHIKSVEG